MKNEKLFFIVLLLVSTFLGSVGQLLFKIGVDAGIIESVALYIVLGMIAYGISTLIYLFILGRSSLSWAYGFVGFSYIFTTVFAMLFLNETISETRWIGVVIIAIGTALIGLS